MPRSGTRIVAFALLVSVLVVSAAGAQGWTHPTPLPVPAGPGSPSVLLIITDDQRWDGMDLMPIVQRELVARGVTFANSFVSNSLCCPSRAAILTGNLSHTITVYREKPWFGAFPSFPDRSTLATWLQGRGYATGLFGKYIDAYQHAASLGYVPPGWNHWEAFSHSQYTGYLLSMDGHLQAAAPADYATDVLGRDAETFIRTTSGPVFVEFAPPAPHAPATPAPQDAHAFANLPPFSNPAVNEADMSDKPASMRALPPLSATDLAAIQAFRRNQYRTLLDVDRWVGRLVTALQDTGRLSNTLIVFTSDNGIAWGEHRWTKKEVPYEPSIRVPLVIRYDPLTASTSGQVAGPMAVNIDLAPTIAGITGTPTPHTDGVSLAPLLRSPSGVAGWRTAFVLEHMEGSNRIPTYCGVRTDTEKYVRYATGEQELYDLRTDPYELQNVASISPDLARLSALADAMCHPKPPGWFDGTGAPEAFAVVVCAFGFGAVPVRSRRRRRRPQGTR